jgi:hypothetical protein
MVVQKTNPSDIRLRDPLSEVTRNERKILLGASAIGIIIVKTGLVPSKISALGIEFTQTDQRSLLSAIAAIIFYFLVAFIVYASSDFLGWRLAFHSALKEIRAERRLMSEDDNERHWIIEREVEDELRKRYRFHHTLLTLSRPISFLRAMFEFAIPIIISVYAIVALLMARV